MYQQNKEVFQRVFLAVDLVLTVVSFFVAYKVKTTWLPPAMGLLYPPTDYLGLFFLILPLWAMLLYQAGVYEPTSTEPSILWMLRLGKFLGYGFLLLTLLLFLLRVQYVSRLLLFLFLLVNFTTLVAARVVFRIAYRFRTHKNRPRVMLVGYPDKGQGFLQRLQKERGVPLDISALYFLGESSKRREAAIPEDWIPAGVATIEHKQEIPYWIHEKIIDEIIFTIRPEDIPRIGPLLSMADEEGIVSRIVADVFQMKLSQASWDQLGSIPMITFSRNPARQWELFFKNLLDLSAAFTALVATLPLFIIIAVLVKKSSPGPVFFRQQRVGMRGHVFTMIKFRTMIQEAEAMRKELWEANQLSGPVFKMADDPRITRVGKFLRRHSLDELPQLLHVLAGNMSLVGPRPALPEEVAQYQPWQRRRLSMRPGITGLWQVSGQDKKDFNDWVFLDLDYIDRWSLSLDLRILWMTLPHVIQGKGM